jgi:hypothetical protein
LLSLSAALALIGCASAPQPVVVTDDDLSTVRAIIASLPADSPAPGEYGVSEVDVRDRAVTLGLVAEAHGKGWERADRATCRRCADDGGWSCERFPSSVHTRLRTGSWVSAEGLSLDQTKRAIDFLARRSQRLAAIDRLRALEGDRICVEYGSTDSPGHLVLKKRGVGFAVDTPGECGGADPTPAVSAPRCP